MKLIEIRKYQNRRYYNTTESRHMSLEEIHRKICEGNDIRVTDAKSGADITAKVLMQILLEYEPLKVDFFSSDLLQRVIRVNDSILKEFFERYFGKALESFFASQKNVEGWMRDAHSLAGGGANPFAATMEAMNPFASMFGVNAGGKKADTGGDRVAEELEKLRREIEALKKSQKKK